MNVFDFLFSNPVNRDKNFILNRGESITFTELYRKSLVLAKYLKANFGTGKNILIISNNSVFFVTAYLGILKSGNVAVPLNPDIEKSNLDYILHICRPVLTFLESRLHRRHKISETGCISEDSLNSIFANHHDVILEAEKEFDRENTAEIIFTSGSTGKPKGVVISHKNLIANTSSIVEYLKLSANDIMLVVLPFYYCYGLSLLHTHLYAGGSIVFNNMFIMLGKVIEDLITYKCTGFAGVPSHFQILLRKSDTFRSRNFPDLKYVTQAGGRLHNIFIEEFVASFPEVRFYVMYGQTEATARLSYLDPLMLRDKLGSCGKGIPGVVLKIVDDRGNEVKTGKTGEIIASGDNIMKGYYMDPETTGNVIKNGWLHTGDLGMVDDEGYIFLTARKKEIIKVGGKRVSPKEIEGAVVTMPDVIDCAIEGVFDEMLGEKIRATVTVKADSAVNEESVKKWCMQRLSSYKVPQDVIISKKISMSSTGKKIKL